MPRKIPHGSGFSDTPKPKQQLGIAALRLGHSCPTRCPRPSGGHSLGDPLSITEAADLIGCSSWTVRQRLIPLGLPFFRSGPSGKLIFYRDQVCRWIETRQGGKR